MDKVLMKNMAYIKWDLHKKTLVVFPAHDIAYRKNLMACGIIRAASASPGDRKMESAFVERWGI